MMKRAPYGVDVCEDPLRQPHPSYSEIQCARQGSANYSEQRILCMCKAEDVKEQCNGCGSRLQRSAMICLKFQLSLSRLDLGAERARSTHGPFACCGSYRSTLKLDGPCCLAVLHRPHGHRVAYCTHVSHCLLSTYLRRLAASSSCYSKCHVPKLTAALLAAFATSVYASCRAEMGRLGFSSPPLSISDVAGWTVRHRCRCVLPHGVSCAVADLLSTLLPRVKPS